MIIKLNGSVWNIKMNYNVVYIIVFICMSITQGSAIVSNGDQNALGFSFSFIRDNEDIISTNGQIDKMNSDMIKFKLGCVFKGKYEFSYAFKNIENIQNGYMLPFSGNYNFLKFNYHFKEKENFPLNLSFGVNHGRHNSHIFSSFGYSLELYKIFQNENYPIATYLSLNSYIYKYEVNNIAIEKEFMHNKTGVIVILPVKGSENNPIKDSICIDIYLNEIKNDLFLGITIGLSHPISS